MTKDREKKLEEIRNECAEVLAPGIAFAVEDGWLPLIHTTLSAVETVLRQHQMLGSARAVQIKEKLGELRIYVRPVGDIELPDAVRDDIQKLSATASDMSLHLCERCGDAGRWRNLGGYYQTLCDRHADQREAWVQAGRPGSPWEYGV